MARLLGFNKTKAKGTGGSKADIPLLEKSYLNSTKYGEFSNSQEVDGFITLLNKLPQTPDIQEKIADLTNKKLKFEANLNDISSDKSLFDMDLQDALNSSAENGLSDIRSMMGSFATIYSDASERFDNELMSKVFERYGTSEPIPQDMLDYRKKLEDKAKFFSDLFNKYHMTDPDTGEVGFLNTEGLAMQIDTNPATGNIQRIDIVPSSELGSGYMRTDTPVNVVNGTPGKKLPIYLKANVSGATSDGKEIKVANLGGITYEGVADGTKETKEQGYSSGQLTVRRKAAGFLNKINFLTDSPQEEFNKQIESAKQNGLDFSKGAFRFDSADVPDNATLQMGDQLYYSTGKAGEILKVDGKDYSERRDNLDKYLLSLGEDPKRQPPYLITRGSLTGKDGNSKVKGSINGDSLLPSQPVTNPTVFTQKPSQPAPSGLNMTLAEPAGFFQQKYSSPNQSIDPSRVNRPNKPNKPAESSGGQSLISDVIEKGKSFFRNLTQ